MRHISAAATSGGLPSQGGFPGEQWQLENAKEALRLSEERFYRSLEIATDAIFLVCEGRCCYANSAGLALLGAKTLEDIATDEYVQRVHADSREAFVELVEGLQGDAPKRSFREIQLLRMDGSITDVECSGTLIPVGTTTMTELVVRDVTERKRAEAALRHSRDLLQYVIEHDRSAVAIHDRDLNYIYVSQRYLQEYGIEGQDVIGRHHYEVFPDLPEKWRVVHQKALKGAISSAENDPYEHEDGKVDWTRWECRPWYEADGSIGGIIVYTEVINEQKKIEERLLQYQKHLRALAAELVSSSEREQWRLASELHDGVGQLLVAAKMEAQILGGDTADQEARRHCDKIVSLLAESIDEVRSLTAQLAPTILLGRGLAGALKWLAERDADLYGLRCTVRVDKSAEAQSLDSKLLVFRMVREALNNVVRHSHTDRAFVTVRHVPGRISVSVTDRGVGFDPGEAEDPILSRHFGLFSISEECLVRGGSLKVWSEPGRGTRVTASIPDNLESVSID